MAYIVAARGWPPAHLDADGDLKPEPKPPALPLMRAALRTTESCGPDGLYEMRFKFRSLEEMQKADGEWREFTKDAK